MAQGAHLRIAMAMNGSLQQDMNMNMDEGHMDIDGQPQQQQQRRRVQFAAQSDLGAGMGRELLGRPSDPRLSRMPARPPAPEGGWGSGAYQPAYSVSPGSHGATPHSETGSGSDLRQQDSWQQPQEQDGMQGDTPRSGPSPATDAAAAAAAGHPVFEQQQPLPGPAPEGLSPLQVVLAGYKPQWPLLPSDEQVLELLRTQGLTGLTVYLDEGAFADLTVPGKVGTGEQTRQGHAIQWTRDGGCAALQRVRCCPAWAGSFHSTSQHRRIVVSAPCLQHSCVLEGSTPMQQRALVQCACISRTCLCNSWSFAC